MASISFYPEVISLLEQLLSRVERILGKQFVGLYLTGLLAIGDFDRASDVDCVVVTDAEISADSFLALQAMHDELAAMDVWCAPQLECTYISRSALRRFDPATAFHANIDRGSGERLKIMQYDEGWVVHCDILCERGIVLAGPAPKTLIDPVAADDLRRAMVALVHGWATHILGEPAQIDSRGYQSYVVLSLCRILYTLRHGTVVSKPIAARWAKETLDPRWAPLVERA